MGKNQNDYKTILAEDYYNGVYNAKLNKVYKQGQCDVQNEKNLGKPRFRTKIGGYVISHY